MAYLSIALLCLTIVAGSFANDDIHTFMSHEEVQQVFHTDHDSVPKYEIVKVHFPERLHKRDLADESKMHIRAFGEDINLWLHPRDSVLAGEDTPVYYAKYSPDKPQGVEYSRRDGLMGMVGRIFEDPYWLASFVIGTDDSGATTVNGHIASKKITVRSLPRRVAEEYRRRRRSVDDSDDLDALYHVAISYSESYEENYPALPVNVTTLRKQVSESASGIPDTLYPEVLVVVENSIYKAYGQDIYGLLEYLLAFWNGVDLKYRSLESPKVRLHIAGIILAEDPEATPYISNYTLGDEVFNSTAAFPSTGEFYWAVKDEFPLDTYDVVITMTRQKFGIDSGTLGVANVGTACKHFDGYYATSSFGLVLDDGSFRSALVAAHELGHLIGANHDLYGGDCVTESGFIMAFTPHYTTNTSDFSSCSVDAFKKNLKNHKLDCLFNPPKIAGKTLPRLMPGRMKSLEEQCKDVDMGAPCQTETTDVCSNFYCLDGSGQCSESRVGALDGTSCGKGNNLICRIKVDCTALSLTILQGIAFVFYPTK